MVRKNDKGATPEEKFEIFETQKKHNKFKNNDSSQQESVASSTNRKRSNLISRDAFT